MKRKQLILCCMVNILTAFLLVTTVYAQTIDPFSYFHVYSLNSIDYSNSDFQGTTGAARNVNFNNFLLTGMDPNQHVLHAGGDIAITNGRYNGSIESIGNIILNNILVNGNVTTGRNAFSTAGGTVTGDISATGIIWLTPTFNALGNQWSGTPYTPVVDHSLVSTFFRNTSKEIGILGDTGTVTNKWGALTLQATSGINIFSIDAADLNTAYSVTINGPEDAVVYLNTTGLSVNLNSTNWYYNGGITAGDVLLNYSQAQTMALSGGNNINILAPFAATDFSSGLVTGNLIVGDLQGHGQVNIGHFSNVSEVPEPATMMLFGSALTLLSSFAGRLKKHSNK